MVSYAHFEIHYVECLMKTVQILKGKILRLAKIKNAQRTVSVRSIVLKKMARGKYDVISDIRKQILLEA